MVDPWNEMLAILTKPSAEVIAFNKAFEEVFHCKICDKYLSEHEGDVKYNPMDFDPDNKKMYYLTNEGNEFTYLMEYNIETQEMKKVLETKWDIWYAYHSYNGKYRVVGINEDAKTVIRVFDMENGNEIDFPKVEDGEIKSVSISRSEKLMKFSVGSSKSPSDIYVYSFETNKKKSLISTSH